MRLVIDLQGAQGASRGRGIGRLSRELALAMARGSGAHEVLVALNGRFAGSADELAGAFAGILGRDAIRIWYPTGGTALGHPDQPLRVGASERIRSRFLAELKPDLLHVSSLFEGAGDDIVTGAPPDAAVASVATLYDLIPLIRREQYLDGAWRGGLLRDWYLSRLDQLRRMPGMLAISESSRQEAISHLGTSPDRVFNIRAGVGESFRPIPIADTARAAFLARYGLREGFILFLGGGDLRKNEAGLIVAYGRLPPALRAAHKLVIVGRVLDEPGLRKSASDSGVAPEDLVLIPFVDEADLPTLYSVCTLFVFPSLHEGFGLPAAEAMACGAPVIASDCTSLPEVVGRADALFDPLRPESIAERMHQALTDEGFRRGLAAHGPVQAAGFTWAESARRAWAGLEAIHALRPAAKPAPAPQRRSLAITAPLPPQPTGIANYTSQLLTALADEYDITLVSADPAGVDAALVGRFSILDPATFLNRAGQFDRVLHQVGNSRFHAFQFDCLMPRVPGVMVLHDVFLSNALHALAHGRGEPDGFRDALLRTQGVAGVCLAAREGELAAVRALPSSLEQIRQSLGLILHSRHARDLVRDFYGEGVCAGVHIVPTTRELGVMPDRAAARARLGLAATALVVASFGGVTAFKMPEVIIAGFAAALRDRPGAVLALVGEAEPSVAESLAAQANAAGIGDALRLTGRIVDATYLDWLAATDIAVQLRRDSRGETSAAAADCLAAGVASIVNGHGALGELPPDTVIMLPDRVETAELAREIGALAQATERRRALGAAGRAHAVLRWSAGTVAAQYRDAIEACYAAHPPAVLAAEVLRGVRALAHGADAATVRAIGKALAESFPFPRPRRIMFDISAWSDPEHGGDASDDWSVLATALLTATGLSDRGEWLSWQGGRAVVAWGDAATWLDIAPLADVPSERTMPGDLLLCPLGPNPTDENALALAEWARRGGARVVGLAWSGRHPPAPAVADATLVLDALADTKPHSADGLARAVLAAIDASAKY